VTLDERAQVQDVLYKPLSMEEFVRSMHEKSGLTEQVRASTIAPGAASPVNSRSAN